MAANQTLTSSRPDFPVIYLRPSRRWFALDLHELWIYRELIYFMTWRDVKVRYKQTALGIAWAVIQPLLTVLILTLVFERLLKVQSNGIPYPLFAYSALLPWQLFQGALQRSSMSVVTNANLLTKIYFPRLIIPISAVLSSVVDFGIQFVVLLGMMLVYGVMPTWQILWLPLLMALALLTALAVGLWLSALNVQYRDVSHIIPVLIQIWMYASPIVYPIERIPEKWRPLFGLNPMSGVIQGFRWALLGKNPPDATFIVSVAIVAVTLLTGLIYFKHMERTFADTI
jgi:lipopolysaccharide transport system permease protein